MTEHWFGFGKLLFVFSVQIIFSVGLTHVCSNLLELELTLNLVIDIELCVISSCMYVYLLPSIVTENLVATPFIFPVSDGFWDRILSRYPSNNVVVTAGIMMSDQ